MTRYTQDYRGPAYNFDDTLFEPGGGPGAATGGGTGYTGGTPYSGSSTYGAGKNSRKWAGAYTFYDKLFEDALADTEVEKQQGDYWMDQGQQAWEQEGDWLNQRPGQYGGYGVQRPGDFSFDGRRPTWQDPEAFNSGDWTGTDKYGAYQDQAFAGQPSWQEMRSEYERNRASAPGGDYKGWQDVQLDAFDAEGAFNKYAEGANTRFRGTLQDQLDELSQTAAGRGRLNTGYFELDTGDLGRRLSDDFRADALMKALDVNNQNLDYIKAKGQVGLGNQEGRLKAYETGQNLAQSWQTGFNNMAGTWMGEKSKANALGADMLASDRNFAKDVWQNKFDMNVKKYDAETGAYENDRDFAYKGHRDKTADWESDRDFDQSTWRDNYEAWSDTAGRYRDRAQSGTQLGLDWRDRYADAKTGLRQEWLGREEAAKDRKAGKDASKRQMWGEVFGSALGAGAKIIRG